MAKHKKKKKERKWVRTHAEAIRTVANIMTVILQIVILIKVS